jgi:hypothetical protein
MGNNPGLSIGLNENRGRKERSSNDLARPHKITARWVENT